MARPPARILVVDDDGAVRSGLVQLLKRAGYEVAEAGQYEEARAILHDHRPDVLITDIRLGEYNGLQLLVGVPEPVPTIVVTGYDDPVLAADARAFGAPFLLKPIVPAHLLETVEDMLARTGGCGVRRWVRKRPAREVEAEVDGALARILDISYGGMRVEFHSDLPRLPESFTVTLPSFSLPVDLVWRSQSERNATVCGLEIGAIGESAVTGWQQFVDAIV